MDEPQGGVGGLLRAHRIGAGMTQRELAGRAGLSVRALRNIEQDRVRRPQTQSAQRLAAALGLAGAERERLLSSVDLAGTGARPDVDTRLHIDVLGPLSVRRGDTPVDIGPHKHRCLLGAAGGATAAGRLL